MAGLNKVTLIGNLGQDPDISHANNWLTIAKFSLATSDARPDQDGNVKTEWHRVVAFSKTAEYVEKYIKKGATICVEGRIQYGKYDNKDGITVYTTDIICNNLINLTKREGGYQNDGQSQQNNYQQSGGYQQQAPAAAPQQQQRQQPVQQQQAPAAFNVESNLTDDDLPF